MRQLFNGFTQEAFSFLSGIRDNNNHEWFEAHKSEYEKYVREPMKALAADLSDGMLSVDPLFTTGARAVSRIRRDTRFSGDKTPYKSVSWLVFKRPKENWLDAPAFFFELNPKGCIYGMGFYSASPSTMRRFREIIDKDAKRFRDSAAFYYEDKAQPFTLYGDFYKRIPEGPQDLRIKEWYGRKSLYLTAETESKELLCGGGLPGFLLEKFFILSALYGVLLDASREPSA